MSRIAIESVLRLLLHARNSHGPLREQIRTAIRHDVHLLRTLKDQP